MEKLKELEKLVDAQLNECDYILTPTICAMKDTPESKKELKEKILKIIIEQGLSVGQAINEIEKQYNPNLIND